MGFSEVTARENMCSRSSAGKSRRWDLGGFSEKSSMVSSSRAVSMGILNDSDPLLI
jgi:hypothetical protein